MTYTLGEGVTCYKSSNAENSQSFFTRIPCYLLGYETQRGQRSASMAAVKFLVLIIFGLSGLISSSKLQINTGFTDATRVCPTLLGFLIKPTCVPLGLEALLSAVLRN